jgi:hypothetical protein
MKLLLIVVVGFAATHLHAQSPPPTVVVRGFEMLGAGHCSDAFREWSTAWVQPEDAGKREALLGSCATLAAFGKMHGHDIVRIVTVTPHLTRVYAVLRYTNQPIYLLVVAYRPDDEWKVLAVNWHTFSEKVFPPEILSAERRDQ